ncbi:fructosamine kinase family protein [Winogradskyella vincentii]|uniref:Fructosamine kinase family protein n=1 Tax=Winogradskyella vincentii TaxID=2877122 RepID=A0ABS7Y2G3_9FLAO|nr:fructosamine kinase family protein [Winogradskyella vincentii]MCA0153434.1 fructosamine kinase family protein [Winogradskyella vincentii]
MHLIEGLQRHIEDLLDTSIVGSRSLSGGDTASVYKLDFADKTSSILKYSRNIGSVNMFEAEVSGLQHIASTNTIATPSILNYGTHSDISFILMEYVKGKSPSKEDYEKLGYQLAQLHFHTSDNFGLDDDNFIGSLEQKNNLIDNWVDFYSEQRLGFQIKMAIIKGLLINSEIPSIDDIKTCLQSYCKKVKPSLIHGDLWNGNFIVSEDGRPYLIDPSVSYSHSEMDIAMSRLFGGFDSSFYQAYHNEKPITEYYEERIEIYQLYYLLVHLNIFGTSYYGSVKRILNNHF